MKVLGQHVTKTAQKTTQSAAKKIAQGHLEVLRAARDQVVPTEAQIQPQNQTTSVPESPQPNYADLEAKSHEQSKRLLDQLEAELAQIRRQREIANQQRVEQQHLSQPQPIQTEVMMPSSKPKGGFRGRVGAMKKKLSDMASRGEKQRNVSG